MQDISGFGLSVTLIAIGAAGGTTGTFPLGVSLSQFADDADPLDSASIQMADTAMGLNGDLVAWAKAQKIPMVLNVIPGSTDDQNLQILADANRVGKGKTSAADQITATIVYPDGSTRVLTNGRMTDSMFAKSVASAGRLKTKAYAFAFENSTGT